MTLDRPSVEAAAEEYREREPLHAVESEQLETLPTAFATGEFGWRDAEWVVRWYFRRFLGAYPDAERRAVEERFRDNDFETVRKALVDVTTADDVEVQARVERLTGLEAVGVPVASAFLFFADPDQCVVVGEREWEVLRETGELDRPYPDPPSVTEYETYLDTCRSLAGRFDCDLWTLYRALWRLWKE